tara:strand:- start:181 stop:921 length:741 start_codon:yes stop_codon:yes gene_type:complete
MKHLVTSGCSFSDTGNPYKSWPLHLQDLVQDKYHFYHLGACAQGEDYISRSVICKVNQLLKDYNSDDIFVIVGWSGLQRRAILVNNETTKMHYRFKDWEMNDQETMRGVHIGSWQDFDEEYLKFLTEEQNIIISLEHIIRTQDFLRANNVDYKFFGFCNLFANLDETNFLTKGRGTRVDKKYPNTSYLFDIMDWNKWWFHNEFGGLADWVNDNITDGFDGEGKNTGHPLANSQKLFTEKVVSKWIK